MFKKNTLNFSIWFITMFLLFSFQNASAATLGFRIVSDSSNENSSVLEVRVDPESKNLNVVEGTVLFSGLASSDLSLEVNTDDSVFTMWPTSPVYNKEEKTIHFVGGTPNGLTKEGLLFIVKMENPTNGKLDISWSGVKTYLNDGKGTEESTTVKSLTLNFDEKKTEQEGMESGKKLIQNKVNLSGFNFNKNVTILSLIIILLSVIFYGYKKFIKN